MQFFYEQLRRIIVVQKLKNMKIGKRLMVSYAVVMVLLLICIVTSVINLVSIGQQITEFYEHPFQVSASANIINAKFEEMQKSVFRAISTEDADITSEAIADAKASGNMVQENMAIVKELYLGDLQDINALETKLSELAPMREHVLDLATQNKNKEAAEYMEEHNIPCIEQIQVYLDKLIETADTTGQTLITSVQQKQGFAVIILAVLGVASFVISMAFANFITKSITEPISEMEQVAENLAEGILDANIITYASADEVGNLAANMKSAIVGLKLLIGDLSYLMKEIAAGNLALTTTQEGAYKGEFRPILMSIRDMNNNLNLTIGEIREASEQVSVGSTQMAESAQGLAEGATEQAGTVEELNATVENVTEMAKKSAEDAEHTSEEISISAKKAEQSRAEMDKLMEAMQRIDSTSKEIVNIIGSIEDIATQTNLLSLNASIEAARAGDAGRGFAVVADQIGKLASDSAQSAANTRELIMKTLDEIQVGNDITSVVSAAFANIIKEVEAFAAAAENIKQQSVEQSQNLQQVSEGIEQISSVVQNNSATAEETSATSEELAAQADNLKELVARFQLKEIK